MRLRRCIQEAPCLLLIIGLCVTSLAYWPGLYGGWLFDDYPNIVDNSGVLPDHASVAALVRAALSSPASDFKRPLASLSFALNYLVSGLDPFAMKLTNLIIHLLNGLLVFVLGHMLLRKAGWSDNERWTGIAASLIAISWLLLPINLTAVLYVVQRMESLANLFVLTGLIGYVWARQRAFTRSYWRGITCCLLSLAIPTAVGVLAKETAVMLPLYACTIEALLFGFRTSGPRIDKGLAGLFGLVLVLPATIGLAWLLPPLLGPEAWATRDFTMGTRILSEARVVIDYIVWTLLPTPHALSFYHDNFLPSSGLFSPWATLISIGTLIALIALAAGLRKRVPLVSLGILLFMGCHLLTATALPLELVYEHRNYFASFGLLLAIVPLLMSLDRYVQGASPTATWLGRTLLGVLMALWAMQTAISAMGWGDPLRLAQMLAERAPDSPRAQYELGRTYIIYSQYDPASPFTKLAYAPLERAAALPKASILPEQALIFMNSRMHLPIKAAWWDSLIGKLKANKPGVQDESSLAALTQCVRDGSCDLPANRMTEAFTAALSHPNPSARLLASYGDYAWNVLRNRGLGLSMTEAAVKVAPSEPAYRITLVRMLIVLGSRDAIPPQMQALRSMNIGGRLDDSIHNLQQQIDASKPPPSTSSSDEEGVHWRASDFHS